LSVNALPQFGSTVTVSVSAIAANFSGGNCTLAVAGSTMPATYDNDAAELSFNSGGDLTVSGVNVAGGLNRFHNGDTVDFFATFYTNHVQINMG
jgi:hypothetical protein